MGNNSSRNGESNRRYVYGKRTKAVPMAYVPPEKRIIHNGTGPRIQNGTGPRIHNGTGPRIITQEIPQPEIGKAEDVPSQPSPQSNTKQDINANETEQKTEQTEQKTNGYVKKTHKKGNSEHIVYREKSHKLYDPEYIIPRERSYKVYDNNPEVVVTARPRSYIHYERAKPQHVVREKGYKMHEPRYNVRRVANTYGTLRPEVLSTRPVQEVYTTRPRSEIITTPRTVRVVRSVPPEPIARTVKAHTIGRPVIVRRSVEQERIYAPAEHSYIPRHRLGEYRPKVIDGYVAPSRVGGGPVMVDHSRTFSDPGGYREVLVEPIYQTVKKVPPPPAYPGRPSEREKVLLQKGHEGHSKRRSADVTNFELRRPIHQTDDEKLKDVPLTQYIDDGKTIMIIDYLLDPFAVKKPPPTVTMEMNQNGEVLNVTSKDDDTESEKSSEHNDELNSSINRQRSPQFGDVPFLP